jgi:tetratricopeptide (TPR) repeat protein
MKVFSRTLALAAVLGWFAAASAATAQDNWVNKKFMPRAEAEYKAGAEAITQERIHLPLEVEQVNGSWLWVGNAWVQKQHVIPLDRAEAYYTERLRRNRQDDWSWAMRSAARLGADDYEGALRDLNEAIRLAPAKGGYYLDRAKVRFIVGDSAGELQDLDAARTADPNNPWVYVRLARYLGAFLVLVDPDEEGFSELAEQIIGYYATSLRLDPSLKEVYVERGMMYESKGDLGRALEDYDQAIRLLPEKLSLYKIRANARERVEDYRGAAADYEHLVANTPDTERPPKSQDLAQAHTRLAWLLATCPDEAVRNGPRAVTLATKACELDQWRSFVSLGALAAAYAESGDFESAVRWQSKAVEWASHIEPLKKQEQTRLDLYRQGKPYREPRPSNLAAPPQAPPTT